MPWPLNPPNDRGKLKAPFYVIFVGSTLAFVGLATFQTAYGGYESPWWLVAGFFLWMLAMMLAAVGMARLQRRANTTDKEFVPLGKRYAGPMFLGGTLLLAVGLVGVLLNLSLNICVAATGCASLPPQMLVAFVAGLAAGGALLALVFGLAVRELGRGTQT